MKLINKLFWMAAFLMLWLQPVGAAYFLTDPYLQNLKPTEVTIMWIADDTKGQLGYVEYKEKGQEYKRAYAYDRGFVVAFNRISRVRIPNLKPGTEYAYRVAAVGFQSVTDTSITFADVTYSDVYHFTTPKENETTVSCKIFNDIHDHHKLFTRMMGYNILPDYDFVFFNGDILNATPSETNIIDNFIKPCTKLFASSKPIVTTRGNHEVRREYARKYFDYFVMGEGELGCYSFTWGPCFFIVLDSSEDTEDDDPDNLFAGDIYRLKQRDWLEKTLQSEEKQKATYTVVLKHIPTYSNTSKSRHGTTYECELYQPLFHQYGIDVLIAGHTHIPGIFPADTNHHYPLVIGGGNTTDEGARDYPTMITLDASRYSMDIKIYNLEGKECYSLTIPNNDALPELEGDIMMLRMGDGSSSLNSAVAHPLFVDRYTLSGRKATLTSTTPLPTTADGDNHRCVGTGSTLTTNFLTRSADHSYLIVGGYDDEVGSKPASKTAAEAPRVVALIDKDGNVNTTTALTNVFDKSDFRCATSRDGQLIYVSGAGDADNHGGVYQTMVGDSTATLMSGELLNTKNLRMFGPHLFTATASNIYNAEWESIFYITPTASDALDFCVVDINEEGTEKVLYWVTGTNDISKFSLVNGQWRYNTTYSYIPRPRALEARLTDDCIQLFVVAASNISTGASKLNLIEDVGGYNGELRGLQTELVDVTGGNMSLRGIAWPATDPIVLDAPAAQVNEESDNARIIYLDGHLYIKKNNNIYTLTGQKL